MSVQDRDLGMKRIVAVGIQHGTTSDGASVAEYATYNEFGTETIPSRPFMATSFDESRALIIGDMDKEFNAMLNGKSAHNALLTIGLKHAQRIKNVISKRNFLPKLSARTIRAKWSTKTLVDTGALINGIRPDVRGRT